MSYCFIYATATKVYQGCQKSCPSQCAVTTDGASRPHTHDTLGGDGSSRLDWHRADGSLRHAVTHSASGDHYVQVELKFGSGSQ